MIKKSIFAAFFAAIGLFALSSRAASDTYGTESFDTCGTGALKDLISTGAQFGTLGSWSTGENDLSRIEQHSDSRHMLVLDTEGDVVTNTLASAAEINAALADGTKDVTFEAEMKFVPSDELEPSLGESTQNNDSLKFALYAYEHEISEGVLATNLVVYHSYYNGEGYVCTNEIVSCSGSQLLNTPGAADQFWRVKVTAKRAGLRNFFSIKVHDHYLYAPLAYTEAELADDGAPGADNLENRIWFRTAENTGQPDINYVTFSGTGTVSDLRMGSIDHVATPKVTVSWTGEGFDAAYDENILEKIFDNSVAVDVGSKLYFCPTDYENNELYHPELVLIDEEYMVYEYTVPGVDTELNITVRPKGGSSQGLVITVSSVGGAQLTGDGAVRTVTVPEGFTLGSVYVNGAALDPTKITGEGSWTIDLSGYEGAVSVVVSAKKIRTSPAHKWYENPAVVKSRETYTSDGGPWRFAAGSDYLAIPYGSAGGGALLWNIDKFFSDDATASQEWTFTKGSLGVGEVRAAAISEALGIALFGSYSAGTTATAISLDAVNLVEGENLFHISNDKGFVFDRAAFSEDGAYLYTAEVRGTGNTYIAKWQVLKGLRESGVCLAFVAEYDLGTRVRDLAYGNGLVYALLDGKAGVKVIDTATGEVSALDLPEFANVSNYGSIAYSEGTGTPHLTVFLAGTTEKGPLNVYALSNDGKSYVSTVATISSAEINAICGATGYYMVSAAPSEDEGTLYLSNGNAYLYAIQAVPYSLSFTVEGGTASEAASPVSFEIGTAKEITFTANDGYALSSVTVNGEPVQGIDQSATSYVYTANSSATVAVVFEERAAALTDPEGGAIEDAQMQAWLEGKGATQETINALGTRAKLTEKYLLDLDLADSSYTLSVGAISAAGGTVTISVKLERLNGTTPVTSAINGTLKLYGAAGLGAGAFADEQVLEITNKDFSQGDVATKTFTSTSKFFKAVIE